MVRFASENVNFLSLEKTLHLMKTKKFSKIFWKFENCSLKCKKMPNEFFQNFLKIFENFKYCSLKMQKKIDFPGKLMGLQNHLRAFFAITKTTWRGKSAKDPLQHLRNKQINNSFCRHLAKTRQKSICEPSINHVNHYVSCDKIS